MYRPNNQDQTFPVTRRARYIQANSLRITKAAETGLVLICVVLMHGIIDALFLRSGRFLRFRFRPLLPNTNQSRLAPRVPQFPIRSLLTLWHVALLDLTNGLLLRLVDDRQNVVCFRCETGFSFLLS